MKRTVVSLIAIVCLMALILSLVSCGNATLDDFKKNLGSDYDVEIYKGGSDMEEMLEELGLDTEEIKVTGVLNGEHKEEDCNVGIIECGDKDTATSVGKTIEDLFKLFGGLAGELVVDVDGVFVFFGNQEAIDDARG